MKPRLHGLFRDVGVPIRVKLLRGSGVPQDIGGREHSHDFAELILFYDGRGVHRVDERDYPVTAGNVFVVIGDQTHAVVERTDLAYAEVTFHADRLELPAEQLKKLPGYHALFVIEPRRRRSRRVEGHLRLGPTRLAEAMRLVESMRREYVARAAGYEAVLVGRLIELMAFLSREYAETSASEAKALVRVGEVVSRLENESERPWRLSELCALAEMSKSSLLVAFREATGHTPIDYLIRVRLRRAMRLLEASERAVTDIAFDVGFSDSNYFARKFRQVVGCSPSAYRAASI